MKVYVQGSEVSLTQRNFLASGGEGSIYVVGGTTYKIYADPSRMVSIGKIRELAEIKDPHVIKPEQIILDGKDVPVGFTSKFVHSSGSLCQIFTHAFRDRNGLSVQKVSDLVEELRLIVENVHKARSLIVDLNEMNFLLGPQMNDLFAIDVASYQTPHYKATALMESIRDRHMTPGAFTELTDWFSFGIVSFQMFIGIHPYKGTHPSVRGLDERMKKNLSVLGKDVRIPQTCYPFTVIPNNYMDWFRSIFENGKRLPPPTEKSGSVVVAVVRPGYYGQSASLEVKEIGFFDSPIVGIWDVPGTRVVVTGNSIYINERRVADATKNTLGAGFTNTGRPVLASMDGLSPKLFDAVAKENVLCTLNSDALMSYERRLYIKNVDKIVALNLLEMGSEKIVVSFDVSANVLEYATKLFSGVAIQNLLGSTFVSLFFGRGHTRQLRIPELDGLKIIDAKYDRGVLMVLCARRGTYDRMVFRVDPDVGSYDLRIVSDVTPSGLNFIVLDSGVCVSLTEEDKLELFSNRVESSSIRVVEDKLLGGDMKLYRVEEKAAFARGDRLYSLSLK